MGVLIPEGYMHVIQPIYQTGVNPYSVTYAVKVPGDLVGPQATIDQCFTLFADRWKDLLDTSYAFGPSVGYFREDDGTLSLWTASGPPVPGVTARNSPPPQVAVVLTKRTARVGKSFRGRVFFVGMIDETNVDEKGVLTPAGVTAFQTRAQGWLLDLNEAEFGMYLLHSKGFPEPIATPVTNLIARSIVRTQRRRLPRGS